MFKLVLAIFLALTTFACMPTTNEVDIVLVRDGELSLMTVEEVTDLSDFPNMVPGTVEIYREENVDADIFIRVDVESNRPLYHSAGDKKISRLRIDGTLYRCDDMTVDDGVFADSFRNEKNQSAADNFYSFLLYLPYVSADRTGNVLATPLVDLCIQIKEGIPNKNPYKNGSTKYTSNVIVITAEELETVLEPYLEYL